jgi:hypothetical protein
MATLRPDASDEQPLDPAAERVRRRLVRFAVINIGILFVAVMLVLGAIVYKTTQLGKEPAEPVADAGAAVPAGGELVEGRIALPSGARIVSQALSGNRLSLQVALADGSQTFLVYDTASGRMIGRYVVEHEE